MLLSVTSTHLLNATWGDDSTTSLHNLFQDLATLLVNRYFLIFNLNLPWSNLRLFSLILLLVTREKRLTLKMKQVLITGIYLSFSQPHGNLDRWHAERVSPAGETYLLGYVFAGGRWRDNTPRQQRNEGYAPQSCTREASCFPAQGHVRGTDAQANLRFEVFQLGRDHDTTGNGSTCLFPHGRRSAGQLGHF